MPPANIVVEEGSKLLRVLLFGQPKTRKTMWATSAASAGFNVLLIDGDDGSHIIKVHSAEVQKKIHVVNACDTFGVPVFCAFTAMFMSKGKLCWDEQAKATRGSISTLKDTASHYILDAKKLTPNDVLIIDSWTALADSARVKNASDMGIDLSDADEIEKAKTSRDDNNLRNLYGRNSNWLTWVLNQFKGLNCHVIVIGHEDIHTFMEKDQKTVRQIRTQLKSSSGNHALQIASKFSDVLYFYLIGTNTRISTEPGKDRDGGSRLLPPKVYSWNELSFGTLCKAINIAAPNNPPPSEAFVYYPPGMIPPGLPGEIKPKSVIVTNPAEAVKVATIGGFSSLMKPKGN